ncbi:CHLPS protein DUF818 [Anaeroplasma bactoclasticum]|jgi:hypothetical protein|uniref:CHLPS protein DUF818 n=1 Tax=Anaeroplasma bactoclasticum TaxID=2088 RepID=A0A397RZ94_9MOLU|nr:dienelactone hydrolase family protein [Anaeroplasma bactoclasticum]RIA77729.1 CHLPS protein DUF818 [Anaeroplasma bactoclasticum]
MQFIKKHILSILVLLFTLLFFVLFLYIDLGQVFYILSGSNSLNFMGIFRKTWFLLIPVTVLIPVIIVFTVFYLKNTKGKRKWITFSLTLAFELIYTFVYSMYAVAPGVSFFPRKGSLSFTNEYIKEVKVDVDSNTYTSLYYDKNLPEVTILFCGNSMTSTQAFNYLEYRLDSSSRNLLVMDYPMFMDNQGRLNEETIYKEVDAYMSYLVDVEGYTYSQIRVAGFSIGTGVACYAAEKYPVANLVLFAPYHKFSAAMNNVTPVFYGPLELCVRFKFNSYDRAPNINCKTTILYSLSDKVIPNSSTKELIPRFKDSEVITYNGYTHSQVFFNPTTYSYLLH